MISITDAINTYNLAIEIIYKKGYELFTQSSDKDFILYVKKDDFFEFAEEPLSLLSIIYIKENKMEIDDDRIDLLLNSYSSMAVDIILDKKYKVELSKKYSSKWHDWIASKKDITCIAKSPLRLLALILIINSYGNNWYSIDIPFCLNNLEER